MSLVVFNGLFEKKGLTEAISLLHIFFNRMSNYLSDEMTL